MPHFVDSWRDHPCFYWVSATLDKTYGDRKHLTEREVDRLLEATRGSRNEARDRCLMQAAGDVFISMEYNLYAVNPRMSYVGKETEDADPDFWRPKPASAKAPTATKKPEQTGQ